MGGGVLHPVGVQQDVQAVTVYDMGQTFSGTCTIAFVNLPARILVSVKYAEIMRLPSELGVNPSRANHSYIRGAASTNTYLSKGVNGETHAQTHRRVSHTHTCTCSCASSGSSHSHRIPPIPACAHFLLLWCSLPPLRSAVSDTCRSMASTASTRSTA